MTDYEAVTPDTRESELVGEILISSRFAERREGRQGWILVKYIDHEIVLFKNIGFYRVSHSIEPKDVWNERLEAGYYKYANIDDVAEPFNDDEFIYERLSPLTTVSGVGDSTIESLVDNNYTTIQSILRATDEELLEVPNLGQQSIDRIRHEFDSYIERVVERL